MFIYTCPCVFVCMCVCVLYNKHKSYTKGTLLSAIVLSHNASGGIQPLHLSIISRVLNHRATVAKPTKINIGDPPI